MSRLYFSATTDMIKTLRTARAKKYMEVWLHFNEENYNDAIVIRCNPQGEKGMLCTILYKGEKIGEIDVYETDHKIEADVRGWAYDEYVRIGKE